MLNVVFEGDDEEPAKIGAGGSIPVLACQIGETIRSIHTRFLLTKGKDAADGFETAIKFVINTPMAPTWDGKGVSRFEQEFLDGK